MSLTPQDVQFIQDLIQGEAHRSYTAGVPKVAPHQHNGIDNLPVQSKDIGGGLVQQIIAGTNITVSPSSGIGTVTVAATSSGGTPGGVDGDLQINASGSFGTIDGLNLDQTGNARGTSALDIQSLRNAVTDIAGGTQSVALGNANSAPGDFSTSIGVGNVASQTESTAIGVSNTASGFADVAIGIGNNSTHSGVAVGFGNTSSTANSSSSFGVSNVASGLKSTAIGFGNTASGTNSLAIGYQNTASGTSVAIGIGVSNGNQSVKIGVNNSGTIEVTQFADLGIGGLSLGGGQGVVFLTNAGTIPTSNPTGGGILYSTGGALHWLGSSGTDTIIAPA